ncbi:MAG: Rdx family protein [Halobacteria archaeon]|nr:Rdx family protein [Halobacteria archaeon]
MTQIEIEYCVPCGFLPRAEEVQHEILEEYGQQVDSVTLKTGDHGVFKVSVDGDLVFDKAEEEYDVETIKESVADRVKVTG